MSFMLKNIPPERERREREKLDCNTAYLANCACTNSTSSISMGLQNAVFNSLYKKHDYEEKRRDVLRLRFPISHVYTIAIKIYQLLL